MRWLLAAAFYLGLTAVQAHTEWQNGDPVPAWVKSQCCGVADAHRLRPDQVHEVPGGYYVDGYSELVPTAAALPSQDGAYWIFYGEGESGGFHYQTHAYCFFVPMNF